MRITEAQKTLAVSKFEKELKAALAVYHKDNDLKKWQRRRDKAIAVYRKEVGLE